jgi:molybdopterin molybdotransferase
MKLLTVDSIEEAQQKLLDCAREMNIPRVQNVQLHEAPGRVCAGVTAPVDVPSFARATVDGYAVLSKDTSGAAESIPSFLTLVDSVAMGCSAAVPIHAGECVYVPTGGMIPQGADAMVMVEYAELLGEKKIAVYAPAAPGAYIALTGEDVQKDSPLILRGTILSAKEVGALAGSGVVSVPVFMPIPIAIISTGDELIAPEHEPASGKIRDINSSALKTLAERNGFMVNAVHVLADDEARLLQTLRDSMQTCSIVIVSGGSSQGNKDMTAAVISRVSKLLTHGVAIKPGKPTILGWDKKSKTIFAGLPGHPVSAMVVFELLFMWLFKTLTEQKCAFPIPARMACNIASSPGKTTVQPVTLYRSGMEYTACPVFGKSGMMSTLTKADGYILINKNTEGLKKSEPVLVYLY